MDARKVFHVAGEKIKGLNDDNQRISPWHRPTAAAGRCVPSMSHRSEPDHHTCGRCSILRDQHSFDKAKADPQSIVRSEGLSRTAHRLPLSFFVRLACSLS